MQMPLNLEGDEAEDENPEGHSAEIQQDTHSDHNQQSTINT